MKTILWMTLVALLSGGSVFAQSGHGVSGPDTGGSKVNLDEKLLTRDAFLDVMKTCSTVEVLEIANLLAKKNVFTLSTVSQFHPRDSRGCNVINKTCDLYHLGSYLDNSEVAQFGSSWFNLDLGSTMGAGLSLQVDLAFKFAPGINLNLVSNIGPHLQYIETALPNAYDEYGRVITSRIFVTPLKWIFADAHGNEFPAPKSPLQLFNEETNAPVQGAFFNHQRFMSCVNMGIGKYVPSP